MAPAPAINPPRPDRQFSLLEELEQGFVDRMQTSSVQAHQATYRRAAQLMRSPRARAFDLSQEQAALRAGIRQLTPIEGEVSRAVQAQYEANPYPRWISTGTPRRYASRPAVAA